jgi:hypothetical protein
MGMRLAALCVGLHSCLAVIIRVEDGDMVPVSPRCPGTEVPFPGPSCLPLDVAYTAAYNFLVAGLPSWDRTNAASLGFHSADKPGVDGLELGLATLGINISLATKRTRPWAWDMPQDIFNEYVVTYAHVNEARTNWRPFLTSVVDTILKDNHPRSTVEVVDVINANLWDSGLLGNNVVFKSSQTPLIYDPMSTIVFGHASCTGVSILFADALRAAGVPARIAGTPAWNGKPENGNHNWVEVYLVATGKWHFIEALVAGPGEQLNNPCSMWFCSPAKMVNWTRVFAARWRPGGKVFPMAWDPANVEVAGEDRTQYYREACRKC